MILTTAALIVFCQEQILSSVKIVSASLPVVPAVQKIMSASYLLVHHQDLIPVLADRIVLLVLLENNVLVTDSVSNLTHASVNPALMQGQIVTTAFLVTGALHAILVLWVVHHQNVQVTVNVTVPAQRQVQESVRVTIILLVKTADNAKAVMVLVDNATHQFVIRRVKTVVPALHPILAHANMGGLVIFVMCQIAMIMISATVPMANVLHQKSANVPIILLEILAKLVLPDTDLQENATRPSVKIVKMVTARHLTPALAKKVGPVPNVINRSVMIIVAVMEHALLQALVNVMMGTRVLHALNSLVLASATAAVTVNVLDQTSVSATKTFRVLIVQFPMLNVAPQHLVLLTPSNACHVVPIQKETQKHARILRINVVDVIVEVVNKVVAIAKFVLLVDGAATMVMDVVVMDFAVAHLKIVARKNYC